MIRWKITGDWKNGTMMRLRAVLLLYSTEDAGMVRQMTGNLSPGDVIRDGGGKLRIGDDTLSAAAQFSCIALPMAV